MNKFKILFVLLGVIIFGSCNKDETVSIEYPNEVENLIFSVNNNYLLKNNFPFQIKGVVYVPGYPGYLPWEIEKSTSLPHELRNSISTDISNIKAMGANTIRFWGAPKYCYEALKIIGDLNFIQTIWIKGDEPDFQNTVFKEITKSYIREVVDRIYSVFNDNSPPLVAYIVGNELSETSILSTDAAHPQINNYSGNYIITDSNITATEAFLAEMADYTRTYEFETYGNISLISYANEIRTADIIETPFLDFISHNAYSYAVPYYRPNTSLGSNSGTIFQGWVEEIKSKHPNKPLLITETGLSVSPNANHVGAPNYGYGGNTELEQWTGLLQNINDINTTALPTAGVCIHEYLDAWWKFGLEDSYSQDPEDIEEWFGIVKLKNTNDWYSTEFRDSYNALKNTWELN
jgi:exo-beta-1,3-glucanase (GH17 family)